MRNIRNTMFATAAIMIGTFGAGSLMAQDNEQAGKNGQGMHDNMMEDGGMMGMMGEMNDMMEKCNAMMDSMQEGKETDTNA